MKCCSSPLTKLFRLRILNPVWRHFHGSRHFLALFYCYLSYFDYGKVTMMIERCRMDHYYYYLLFECCSVSVERGCPAPILSFKETESKFSLLMDIPIFLILSFCSVYISLLILQPHSHTETLNKTPKNNNTQNNYSLKKKYNNNRDRWN